MNKSDLWIKIEGALYAALGGLPPIAAYLESDRPLSGRSVAAALILGIVGAATSLKAFMSQSASGRQDAANK